MRWQERGNEHVARVEGLPARVLAALRGHPPSPAQWQELLAVYVAGAELPLAGRYSQVDDAIELEPRFPLEPGLTYRAVLRTEALTDYPHAVSGEPGAPASEMVADLRIAPTTGPPATTVLAVHPSGRTLPENLLRLYLQFSAPMAQGDVYRHVRLLDSSGATVELAILELEPELWDPTGTRLTLLFDPGRIKSGLRPRREVGSALHAGGRYTLVVDAAWRDSAGRPLAAEHRHGFEVVGEDRQSPRPSSWRVEAPASGTRDPLAVRFDEPLDRAQLQHALRVVGPAGDVLAGEISVDDDETGWRLRPASPWRAGDYVLEVDTTLEDRAGNSLARLFEREQGADPPSPEVAGPLWRRPFRIETP